MKNEIHGKVERLDWAAFLALFDESVHDDLTAARLMPGTAAMVVFENLAMDSSAFGDRTALRVGPRCSYTLEAAVKSHLGQTPSVFQYARAYTDAMPDETCAECGQTVGMDEIGEDGVCDSCADAKYLSLEEIKEIKGDQRYHEAVEEGRVK